jgi:D-amino-acid dehydrogenase
MAEPSRRAARTGPPAHPPKQVIVIGAGIVGVCAGLFLQRSGHAVTIIDPKPPGRGTSFGNAGSLAVGNINPVGTPGLWKQIPGMLMDPTGPLMLRWSYMPKMLPWLARFLASGTPGRVEQLSREIRALTEGAVAAHDLLLSEIAITDIVKPVGWMKVYGSAKTFEAAAPLRDLQNRNGVKLEILNEDEIRQLEPGLAPIFTHGAFEPDNGFVTNPAMLTDAYAEAFVSLGGQFIQERVTRFEFEDDKPIRAVTDLSIQSADAFVVCAGAWSDRLTKMLGTSVPLDTERGYHLNLNIDNGPGLRRPVIVGDKGFGLSPMQDGLRLTSGVEFAGVDAAPNFRRIHEMHPLAKLALPGLGGEVTREWMGHRPSMPDSKPVIGGSSTFSNVFFAFGHGHLGLTMAARTGQIIDDLVSGREPDIDLAPYCAGRF